MKSILTILFFFFTGLYSHAQKPNWQNLDLQKDSVFGISTEKAYDTLLKNKKASRVTVAILDSGIDTAHEDLKAVLWTNPKEIPGNGLDDDHNGYIDDIYGWNFIASEIGKEDLTNLVLQKKDFYDSLSYTKIPEFHRADYKNYRKLSEDYFGHIANAQVFIADLISSKTMLDTLLRKIGKKEPTATDFRNYLSANGLDQKGLDRVIGRLPFYKDYGSYIATEVDGLIEILQYHIDNGLSMNPKGENLKKYATNNGDVSNDITGPLSNPNPTYMHGTHLAGIIAADRNNLAGIKGVADHASIMMIKIMSSIRELRDANLAQGIHYAVDNGAKIICLSFGKPYTWNKKDVDEAVKYAMRKDVLIIHAAGNSGDDLDNPDNKVFPNRYYSDKSGEANAWINVGASGWKDDSTLAASFSNYGKKTVDVFAPGVDIYSTIPGSRYIYSNGTSMAAPVVAGLAALIREYYPKLTAVQVKDIIMKSVIKSDVLKDKCVSGGVVNAYSALKLASTL